MRIALVLGPVLLLACGELERGAVGDFQVELERETAGLVLSHPSGLVLRTAPAAFRLREAGARYEMQFGTFRIEETPAGDWITGARFVDPEQEEGALRFALEDAAGEVLGRLHLRASPAGLHLTLEAAEGSAWNRARVAFSCDDPAAGGFLGFGAQTHDVDHRGQRVPVWVSEQGIGKVDTDVAHDLWFLVGTRHQSYLPVPSLVAPRAQASYGLLATTDHRSLWDLCAADPAALAVEVWERRAELILSPGPGPLDVLEQQTSFTGRAPAVPDWALGVWMEAVGGEAAVQQEVERLRAARVPLSAVWTEDWRGGRAMGQSYVLEEDWRWDRDLYPGLPGLAAQLHADGVAFLTYFNTFVVEGVDVHPEALAGGHLVQTPRGEPYLFQAPDFEQSGLAELFRPETRDFVQGELEAALALGVDGWMADFAEWYPADPREVAPAGGLAAEAAHQRYPVVWAEVNRAAVARTGRTDTVIFHRSGYTGSQGQAQVIWAGDQRTSFQEDDGLPTIIPILLGLGATGFPLVTHDIGGYASATNPPTGKDLFFRWTSLGALAPVMRTHHGRDAARNWRWSSDQETAAHFRRWAELHTRLFPLFAGLAREGQRRGAPILRPLAFADPGDRRLHGVKDAYTIGDALLVAPVVTASTSARDVPLPRGVWFEWETGQAVEGPVVRAQVPLGELPIYARAGAVVPLLPAGVERLRPAPGRRTLEDVRRERELRVWLGADGAFSDPEVGRFVLESPARPSGALVDLRQVGLVRSSSVGRAEFELRPDVTAELIDAAGAVHRLRLESGAASTKVLVIARW